MKKVMIISIIFLIIGLIASSGCIENTNANNTWGEKKISLDAIKVSNNTTAARSGEDNSTYYVYGYLNNDNQYEAINVKIKITTYTSNGTVFAINDTPYLKQKNIPGKGNTYFYAGFSDQKNEIARYDVKILDAKAEYGT